MTAPQPPAAPAASAGFAMAGAAGALLVLVAEENYGSALLLIGAGGLVLVVRDVRGRRGRNRCAHQWFDLVVDGEQIVTACQRCGVPVSARRHPRVLDRGPQP